MNLPGHHPQRLVIVRIINGNPRGGNVTGMSGAAAEIAGKSLELIREVIPSARRVAVLADETDPFSVLLLAQISEGARSLGIPCASCRTMCRRPRLGRIEAF
jgi:ABC-type uncharacterized transport system substrate-binding protein